MNLYDLWLSLSEMGDSIFFLFFNLFPKNSFF